MYANMFTVTGGHSGSVSSYASESAVSCDSNQFVLARRTQCFCSSELVNTSRFKNIRVVAKAKHLIIFERKSEKHWSVLFISHKCSRSVHIRYYVTSAILASHLAVASRPINASVVVLFPATLDKFEVLYFKSTNTTYKYKFYASIVSFN